MCWERACRRWFPFYLMVLSQFGNVWYGSNIIQPSRERYERRERDSERLCIPVSRRSKVRNGMMWRMCMARRNGWPRQRDSGGGYTTSTRIECCRDMRYEAMQLVEIWWWRYLIAIAIAIHYTASQHIPAFHGMCRKWQDLKGHLRIYCRAEGLRKPQKFNVCGVRSGIHGLVSRTIYGTMTAEHAEPFWSFLVWDV